MTTIHFYDSYKFSHPPASSNPINKISSSSIISCHTTETAHDTRQFIISPRNYFPLITSAPAHRVPLARYKNKPLRHTRPRDTPRNYTVFTQSVVIPTRQKKRERNAAAAKRVSTFLSHFSARHKKRERDRVVLYAFNLSKARAAGGGI